MTANPMIGSACTPCCTATAAWRSGWTWTGYRDLQESIGQAVTAFVEETFRITGTGPGDLERGK